MTTNALRSVRFCSSLVLLAVLFVVGFRVTPAAAEERLAYQAFVPMMMNGQTTGQLSVTVEQRVVDLTNELRLQNGCPALTISPELSASAQAHSQDMASFNYFSHTDLTGHRADWRALQAGYSGSAGWENIGAGYATAEAVVSAWYNETAPNDGHRRNILNCSLTEIGIGYAANPSSKYGSYWTQDFGSR